jgi:hypothetical protein
LFCCINETLASGGLFIWATLLYKWLMEKLLLMAILVCHSGERQINLAGKFPSALKFMDVVVSVEPFYTRLYIYELGLPDSFQQCCNNKPTSVLRVPIGTGQFCVRQSQPQMKWHIRAILKPDVET